MPSPLPAWLCQACSKSFWPLKNRCSKELAMYTALGLTDRHQVMKQIERAQIGERTVDAAVGDRDGDNVRQEHGQPDRQGGQDLQAAPSLCQALLACSLTKWYFVCSSQQRGCQEHHNKKPKKECKSDSQIMHTECHICNPSAM